MNKQLTYIFQAYLLLATIAGAFILIDKIPADSLIVENPDGPCCGNSESSDNVFTASQPAFAGKTLFQSKCATCHSIYKEGTGPALTAFEQRHRWADRKELYRWINNPGAYMQKDKYTQTLKKKYGSMMTAFPNLLPADIDAIAAYINYQTRNY